MEMRSVNVDTGVSVTTIGEAMDIAKKTAASEFGTTPEKLVVVSWFDCKENRHSPSLISGWEDYGESHGATLKVELDDGEYVFLCEREDAR
jgi:hypothetical protein